MVEKCHRFAGEKRSLHTFPLEDLIDVIKCSCSCLFWKGGLRGCWCLSNILIVLLLAQDHCTLRAGPCESMEWHIQHHTEPSATELDCLQLDVRTVRAYITTVANLCISCRML